MARLSPQPPDMRGDALRQSVETVAALEHRDNSTLTELIGEPENHACDSGVAVWRDVELTEQVAAHAVEAGAHQNEVGLETAGSRHELLLECRQDLRITGSRSQRYVQRRADPFACSCFGSTSRPGICAVVVRAEVKDGVVVVEDVLRAVAVVVVEIDDENAANVMDLLQVSGGDGDVVE